MNNAFLMALKSEDPNTKVGVCIADKERRIFELGYNRMPKISDRCDKKYSWSRSHSTPKEWLNSKYPNVLHAEMDAILFKFRSSLSDCTMHTLLFPWNECAKLIVESGFKRVIYYSDKYCPDKYTDASKTVFERADVQHEKFQTKNEKYS